ncbi:hypothetical protein [Nitrolancea hollandica]|uniref:Uncharacterized protein n=1 Tax=Nitrolancea hollandica Lb TaxID=1129897 RepID=I4EG47_9BACT|nr:hypothetical protein [Nitrolancea hollandica]CCF83659.1 hypothetical protein NITHO_2520034 [Nitrolancea hollandica Lb]
MIDTTNRAELAELDATINMVDLAVAENQNHVNQILSDYPAVWDAMFEGIEPDSEDDLASQAERAAARVAAEFGVSR